MAPKKKRTPRVETHHLEALYETAKKRTPLDGDDLHAGVAVMYLDPKLIEMMTKEILQQRRKA